MALLFKTKGNQTPYGKQKVYFCAHPDDYGYFEQVADDILAIQNCAIYYKEDPTQAVDLDDLKVMNMIVVPVTSRFLYQPNSAREEEFKFALANHIAILPLQQEKGLERDFNRICGDLQLLDPNQTDETAISYADKLSVFVKSVLVGDEQRQAIQNAFDGYVFLSYRKKDRQYAQRLMKSIHDCENCRDLAIWYDEFLTPGENFNTVIATMMEKSQIFALVVTPNLLEENNYVQSVEYQKARSDRMIIVPTEMVETDQGKLKQMYEELPDCTLVDNGTLQTALQEACQKVTIKVNGKDPEHNYYIGLAYLSGVDVEVDHDRAVSLIRGSAEQNYVPAMQKMVELYKSGLAVQRDYQQAVVWQKRLFDLFKAELDEQPSAQKAQKVFNLAWQIAQAYQDLSQLNLAQGQAEWMLAFAQMWYEQTKDVNFKRDESICYNVLASIAQTQGDLLNAQSWSEQGLKIDQNFAKQNPTDDAKRNLAISYDRLGKIAQNRGDLMQAKVYYTDAFTLREELARSDKESARHDLFVSYRALGAVAQREGNYSQALDYFKKGFELAQQLILEDATAENKRLASVVGDNIGSIFEIEKNYANAKEFYSVSYDVDQEIVEETDTLQAHRDLALSCERMGDVTRVDKTQGGDKTQADGYYSQMLAQKQHIACQTGAIEDRIDLVLGYQVVVAYRASVYGYDEQTNLLQQKSKELLAELDGELSAIGDARRVANAYQKLSQNSLRVWNLKEAEEYAKRVIAQKEKLVSADSTLAERDDLAHDYATLAYILKNQNLFSQAEQQYLKALALYQEIANDKPTVNALRNLYRTYISLGENMGWENVDVEKYRTYCISGMTIALELLKEESTVRFAMELADCYARIAKQFSVYDTRFAISCYKDRLALTQEIFEKTNDLQDGRNYALACCDLAQRLEATDHRKAKECYATAIELFIAISQESSAVSDMAELAKLYDAMAFCGEFDGDLDFDSMRNACFLYEGLIETCPDDKSYQRRFEELKSMCGYASSDSEDDQMPDDFDMDAVVTADDDLSDEDVAKLAMVAEGYENWSIEAKEKGDYEEAERYLDEALDIRKKIFNATQTLEDSINLADVYFLMGVLRVSEGEIDRENLETAVFLYGIALSVDPDNEFVQAKCDKAQSLLDKMP